MKIPDHLIKDYITLGRIKISPRFDEKNLRPVGLRVHLGDEILFYHPNQVIDLSSNKSPRYTKVNISKKQFELKPGQFILGHTKEKITTDKNILCELDGRSTIARLGLSVHVSAKILDGTFEGNHSGVLEIYNHSNVTYMIKSGLPIGCITFELLLDKISGKYDISSNYKGQTRLVPAKL
ncbi:MAG: dCTP deaminase [Nanoarchaeota archaeon]